MNASWQVGPQQITGLCDHMMLASRKEHNPSWRRRFTRKKSATITRAKVHFLAYATMDGILPMNIKRLAIVAFLIFGVIYAIDFLSLRVQIPRRPRLGNVTVHVTYLVKLKSGKTEYDDGGDHQLSCSNSLFPQLGYQPCWYTARHSDQQISIDSGNPKNPSLF